MSGTLDDSGPYVSDPFVVPLVPGRITPEAEGEGARTFMGATEWGMRALGMETAADNLAHYRNGGGASRNFDDDEIARHPILLRAEDRNRTEFEGRTFMAEMEDKEKKSRINRTCRRINNKVPR